MSFTLVLLDLASLGLAYQEVLPKRELEGRELGEECVARILSATARGCGSRVGVELFDDASQSFLVVGNPSEDKRIYRYTREWFMSRSEGPREREMDLLPQL